MSRDLFTETIIATDKGEVNETGDTSMSFPPSYTAGSCPEKAGDITINQNIISIADGDGVLKVDSFTISDFDATKKIVSLSFTPLDGYPIQVFIQGVEQIIGQDYTIAAGVLTFIEALDDADDVIVRYIYEVA